MAKKKSIIPDTIGLTTNSIRFSIKDFETYDKIKKYYKMAAGPVSSYGKGLLAYEGQYLKDNSIYIGFNPRLKQYILVFLGNDGAIELDSLRSNFLDLPDNEECVENMSVCGINATLVSYAPDYVKSGKDLQEAFETTTGLQTKNVPKVNIDKESLYIGGKTSATSLQIQGPVSADLSVKGIVTTLKLKDKSCTQFFNGLNQSVGVSAATVVAFCINTLIGRTSISPILSSIQNAVAKSFEVGKVYANVQKETKATTKSGKYVIRALSGVRNKMTTPDTLKESQLLFIDWVNGLRSVPKNDRILPLTEGPLYDLLLSIDNIAPDLLEKQEPIGQVAQGTPKTSKPPSARAKAKAKAEAAAAAAAEEGTGSNAEDGGGQQ